MILLAGVLLVMAYLLFSVQAAQFSQIGQQAGREVRNPVAADLPGLRSFLSIALQEELRKDSNPTQFLCPRAAEFAAHAELILQNIGTHQQNRGLDFRATVTSVDVNSPGPTGTVVVHAQFTLSDGTSYYREKLDLTLSCNTAS